MVDREASVTLERLGYREDETRKLISTKIKPRLDCVIDFGRSVPTDTQVPGTRRSFHYLKE